VTDAARGTVALTALVKRCGATLALDGAFLDMRPGVFQRYALFPPLSFASL